MFKSIRLKNFKAYKDSGDVPLAPLTVLVGADNSGKSTLFQAILALAQSIRGTNQSASLVTKGPFVDLNGFHDIVHADHRSKASSFEIALELDDLAAKFSRLPKDRAILSRAELAFALAEETGEIEVCRSTLCSSTGPAISVERQRGKWSWHARLPGVPADVPVGMMRFFPYPTTNQNGADNGSLFAALWCDILAGRIFQIGPLRLRVPWYTSVGARTPAEFGLGGENLVAVLGSKEKTPWLNKPLLDLVNDWISKREILKRLHLQVDRATTVRTLLADEYGGAGNINVAGMGEGISQVLPIVAQTLMVPPASDCLIIEQPEIHLHPALQAELGDLFADVMQTTKRQILVETHSEHLLLRIRRRIAEGKLKPDDVAILFVEKIAGESKVRRLDLNNRGHFSDWPKGFFDEAYQEAMALAEAAAKKG